MTSLPRPLFLLTVDTEEEWNWQGNFPTPPFSTENIKHIPEFQDFCSSNSVYPTYFVDHAVVEKQENAKILTHYFKNGECDIGAHLHPWANPPLNHEINEHTSHAVNLSNGLFQSKMTNLTKLICDTFNAHPYSFRAGRWGINESHLKFLSDLGYQIDSSIRPFYQDNSFSYRFAQTSPYWPSFSNMFESDSAQKNLMEVPVTSGYNRRDFELCERVHGFLSKPPINKLKLIGILWKTNILRKITITPEATSETDLKNCIDCAVKRGDKVINLFFHSSDLLPGATVYVKNEAEKREFMQRIKSVIDHLKSHYDAKPVTMRNLKEHLLDW